MSRLIASRWVLVLISLSVPVAMSGCTPAVGGAGPNSTGTAMAAEAPIAASNSYLEVIVHDLLGPEAPVMCLAGPGMCPGHFDIRPSQVRRLADCPLLLRFDFQDALEARLRSRVAEGPRFVAIGISGGMCEPASYGEACRQVADCLVEENCLDRQQAERRLEKIGDRIEQLKAWAASQVARAGLQDAPVLCSMHQEAFCGFLGLNVVATFTGADSARLSEIDAAVRGGDESAVRWIIANRPEGRHLADALADRLNARVVVFGNFPDPGPEGGFDALVRGNVEQLVAAATQADAGDETKSDIRSRKPER